MDPPRLDARLSGGLLKPVGLGLAVVLLGGVGAAAAMQPTAHSRPVGTAAARPHLQTLDPSSLVAGAQAAPSGAAPRAAARTTPRTPSPAKAGPAAAVVEAKPVARWLPTGTGIWIHNLSAAEGGDPAAIVWKAQQMGLTTLYVQTGSSKKGWIGTPTLQALLPATKGTELKVVAWDFPTLTDPVADARRMARAAQRQCAGCPRVAAVAPDVETAAEGTKIGEAAVKTYYAELRKDLPSDMAILATVPWPSEKRRGKYPYARTAVYADALMPMAYWYNRPPEVVTTTSMTFLKQYGRPLLPVGQAFDSRIDAPYLPVDPHPDLSVQAFLDVAAGRGATAVSMWSWDTAGPLQWAALSAARTLFPAG